MSERILEAENRVVRHGGVELAEHWVVALSGLLLLLSGLFELPMAARYRITAIPGFAWSGDFVTSLAVHYAASTVFIAAALFHLFYHGLSGDRGLLPRRGDLQTSIAVIKSFFGRGEEPPFGKYLPEQRLAYIGMAVIIAVLILSGLVKTAKNLFAPDMDYTLVLWATWLHNIFFVLFILAFIAHIGAILLKPNRPMIRGIFTGSVRLDYARHRHPLWLGGMAPQPETPQRGTDRDDAPGDMPPGETAPPAAEPVRTGPAAPGDGPAAAVSTQPAVAAAGPTEPAPAETPEDRLPPSPAGKPQNG